MKEEIQYIFDALEVSGVKLVDFSELTSISKVSLHRWKTDKVVPNDRLRLSVAYTAARRIKAACAAGLLPLTEPLKREQRQKVIKKIIRQMASEQA